jgi:hypothetical protein
VRPSSADLLSIVYRYYPRGMSEYDPGYKETEAHRRLIQARSKATADGNPWGILLDRLRARFPRGIHNASLHLPTGRMDAGYAGWLELPVREWYEVHHKVGFLISFIAPCYTVYGASIVIAPTTRSSGRAQEVHFSFTPDEEPHARTIAREILSLFTGYEPIPPEIGNAIVPDVVAGNQAMGQTTLYHCLFTDVW